MSHKIHPTAVVDGSARLGEDVEIGAYSIVGADVTIGDRTKLISHVVVQGPTTIAEDCVIHPFAALGGPPQVTFYKGEPTRLEIGPRNVIREYVTMHRGTPQNRGVTTVGADGLFMAQAHVAHDCVVEDRVILAHAATLGGHVVVGEFAIIGGLAAVHQYGRIGKHVKDAQESYEKAVGKLSEGPGNLVRQVEMLKDLGAKTNKAIHPRLLERSLEEGRDA